MQLKDQPPSHHADAFFTDQAAVMRLRSELLRFAVLQVRNREVAEDLVQEALASALKAKAQFAGRASVKTWIFGILRNKIIDFMRHSWTSKRVELDISDDDADFDGLFKQSGFWRPEEYPSPWGNPQQAAENQQFWQIFEICMTRMPEATARVFSMRELLGLEVDEICKVVGISPSNCWVILHRARMTLRLCLQQRWFEKELPK